MRGRILLAFMASFFAVFTSFAGIGKKDTVMIFRPAPGLNDTTDNGGPNGGMDAIAQQPYPTTNYGNHPAIHAAPISNCNSTHSVSFIKFDVGNLPDTVDSVFVGFTHFDHTSYCYSNCNADFYFHRITQRWYEDSVNYNNQPSADTAFYGPINITFPNSFGTREYNITETYRLWRDSVVPNYGFVIKSPTVGCNNAAVIFYAHSSDDTAVSTRPYLKIYYKVDTGSIDTPVAVSPLAGPQNVLLYPNPATSQVSLQADVERGGAGWCVLTDITGRVVYMQQINWQSGRNKQTLPLQGIEKGLYYYTLYSPDGRYSGKLLKQ